MTQQTTFKLTTMQSSYKQQDWVKPQLFDISRKTSLDYMGTFQLEPEFSQQQQVQLTDDCQQQSVCFNSGPSDDSDPNSYEYDSTFPQQTSSMGPSNSQEIEIQFDCYKNQDQNQEIFDGLLKSEQFPAYEEQIGQQQNKCFPNLSIQQSHQIAQFSQCKLEKFDMLDITHQDFTLQSVKFEDKQQEPAKKEQKKVKKIEQQIFKIQKKSIQKSPKMQAKNYDKNICRYLTRRTIRCFANFEYYGKVIGFCFGDKQLYSEATEYFTRRIEQITGFRVLKEYLDVIGETDPKVKQYKYVFKEFYKWFLKERIVRYIMKGEMADKLQYIKYKNEVMLQYVDTLQDWKSNKNMAKQQKKRVITK